MCGHAGAPHAFFAARYALLGSATFPAALRSTALAVLRTVKVLPYNVRLALSGSQDR